MTWTMQIPSTAGFYWHRNDPTLEPGYTAIVEVTVERGKLWVLILGSDQDYRLDAARQDWGEWYGPLEIPT